MTRFEEFVSTLKSTQGAKALALLAAITVPGAALAAAQPPFASSETTLTQQAEESARVPPISSPETDIKIRKLQEEADLLAVDAFRFLEAIRRSPAYEGIFAQQLSPADKLELARRQLNIDLNAFNEATNKKYSDLAVFNDPAGKASLRDLPGFSARVDRISDTIDGIREAMMSFRQMTAGGANRADRGAFLDIDIRFAQAKLASALLAVQQRYDTPPNPERRSSTSEGHHSDSHVARDFDI